MLLPPMNAVPWSLAAALFSLTRCTLTVVGIGPGESSAASFSDVTPHFFEGLSPAGESPDEEIGLEAAQSILPGRQGVGIGSDVGKNAGILGSSARRSTGATGFVQVDSSPLREYESPVVFAALGDSGAENWVKSTGRTQGITQHRSAVPEQAPEGPLSLVSGDGTTKTSPASLFWTWNPIKAGEPPESGDLKHKGPPEDFEAIRLFDDLSEPQAKEAEDSQASSAVGDKTQGESGSPKVLQSSSALEIQAGGEAQSPEASQDSSAVGIQTQGGLGSTSQESSAPEIQAQGELQSPQGSQESSTVGVQTQGTLGSSSSRYVSRWQREAPDSATPIRTPTESRWSRTVPGSDGGSLGSGTAPGSGYRSIFEPDGGSGSRIPPGTRYRSRYEYGGGGLGDDTTPGTGYRSRYESRWERGVPSSGGGSLTPPTTPAPGARGSRSRYTSRWEYTVPGDGLGRRTTPGGSIDSGGGGSSGRPSTGRSSDSILNPTPVISPTPRTGTPVDSRTSPVRSKLPTSSRIYGPGWLPTPVLDTNIGQPSGPSQRSGDTNVRKSECKVTVAGVTVDATYVDASCTGEINVEYKKKAGRFAERRLLVTNTNAHPVTVVLKTTNAKAPAPVPPAENVSFLQVDGPASFLQGVSEDEVAKASEEYVDEVLKQMRRHLRKEPNASCKLPPSFCSSSCSRYRDLYRL